MRLRIGRSLWLTNHPVQPTPRYPKLKSAASVDVAIVGGGFTGAALAWQFADAGISVGLVEAARVGHGSTAASSALLMQEPDDDLIRLSERYGRARARRIWQLSRMATRKLVATLRRLDISCGLRSCDSVYYALTPEHTERLHREHAARTAAGFGGRWLDGSAVRRATGLRGTSGAIRTRGNAQVDPFRACVGLLEAAVARGATIYEGSEVTRIEPRKTHVIVHTSHGNLLADRVIVATGYATPYFERVTARFRMMNTYVIATRRMTLRERRAIGLGNVMLWDSGRPYHYARWTSDRRLLLGGGDRRAVRAGERFSALRDGITRLREFFFARYPLLEDIRVEFAWEGVFVTTPDRLPYIGPHPRYPRHLFALGYGGNGMTLGFLAAQLLLEQYRGRTSRDQRLFAFNRINR